MAHSPWPLQFAFLDNLGRFAQLWHLPRAGTGPIGLSLYQSLIKKMSRRFAYNQSNEDTFLTGVPSSQMTLACVKFAKCPLAQWP